VPAQAQWLAAPALELAPAPALELAPAPVPALPPQRVLQVRWFPSRFPLVDPPSRRSLSAAMAGS
jgi:hypothetical protein